MLGLKSTLTALVVIAFAVGLPFASSAPTPTRKFTVRSYQPGNSLGNGLTGYYLNAKGGSFYIVKQAPQQKPVLSVDSIGLATLSTGAKLFIDTQDGHLGYTTSSAPAGAVFTNFLHRGAGNVVTNEPNVALGGPPADFYWIGSNDDFWSVCGPDLKVYKAMTAFVPDEGACTIVELSALDA